MLPEAFLLTITYFCCDLAPIFLRGRWWNCSSWISNGIILHFSIFLLFFYIIRLIVSWLVRGSKYSMELVKVRTSWPKHHGYLNKINGILVPLSRQNLILIKKKEKKIIKKKFLRQTRKRKEDSCINFSAVAFEWSKRTACIYYGWLHDYEHWIGTCEIQSYTMLLPSSSAFASLSNGYLLFSLPQVVDFTFSKNSTDVN